MGEVWQQAIEFAAVATIAACLAAVGSAAIAVGLRAADALSGWLFKRHAGSFRRPTRRIRGGATVAAARSKTAEPLRPGHGGPVASIREDYEDGL